MPTLSRLPLRPPLQAAIHGVGRYHTATDVGDLARMLTERWPGEHGDVWRLAVEACLEALETQAGADQARAAFVQACRGAGIAVLPDDVA